MKGKVLQTTGSWYKILCDDGQLREARLKGKFKNDKIKLTNPIAVGDNVELQNEKDVNETMITEIYPRKNYIIRQSPRKKFHQHIIASNIDQAILITSIYQPRTSLGFIDRFIIAAESFHIPVKIIINKTDLLKKQHLSILEEWKNTYNAIGYPVYATSIETKEGLQIINDLIKDKTTLLAGHSGVGKSSLINYLAPDLALPVKEISEKHEKGKHTTTYATMYHLRDQTFIIDTPGIKEFGLSQIEPEELSGYFVEMKALINDCKFNNCMHRDEPGCAVKQAFVEEQIAESRYINYLQILENLEDVNYWERS
ncbi:MAG: ribosome small subunit-dependent GTPase A [Bacteroidetes bacterium]|nr:ribosome small subunit-dependent GTPase A [Bacteroidota bacterium]